MSKIYCHDCLKWGNKKHSCVNETKKVNLGKVLDSLNEEYFNSVRLREEVVWDCHVSLDTQKKADELLDLIKAFKIRTFK